MENSVIINKDLEALLGQEPFYMATFMYYALRSRKKDTALADSVGECVVNENEQQTETQLDTLHIHAADNFLKEKNLCSFKSDAVGMKSVTIKRFVKYPDMDAERKAKRLLARHRGRIAPTAIELQHAWDECSESICQWLKDNCPNIFYTYTHLITDIEVEKLKSDYGCNETEIRDIIEDIDNADDWWWKYHNLYRVARNWLQKRR